MEEAEEEGNTESREDSVKQTTCRLIDYGPAIRKSDRKHARTQLNAYFLSTFALLNQEEETRPVKRTPPNDKEISIYAPPTTYKFLITGLNFTHKGFFSKII